MYTKGKFRANPESGPVFVCAGAQMGDRAQVFVRMTFFLKRIGFRGHADYGDGRGLDFPSLAAALGGHQGPLDANGRARGQFTDLFVVGKACIRYDLDVAETRTVIDLDERKGFGIATRPNPALDQNVFMRLIAVD